MTDSLSGAHRVSQAERRLVRVGFEAVSIEYVVLLTIVSDQISLESYNNRKHSKSQIAGTTSDEGSAPLFPLDQKTQKEDPFSSPLLLLPDLRTNGFSLHGES